MTKFEKVYTLTCLFFIAVLLVYIAIVVSVDYEVDIQMNDTVERMNDNFKILTGQTLTSRGEIIEVKDEIYSLEKKIDTTRTLFIRDSILLKKIYNQLLVLKK